MIFFRVFVAVALVISSATAATAAGPDIEIPDRALLRAADLGGAKPREADAESWPALRPPRPCGLETPAPAATRAVTAVIDSKAPVAILEYVALHRPGDARRYLRDLREAVPGCPDWLLVRSHRDSLVLRWTQRWEHVDQQVTHHTFVAVARTGPAIVLVADAGWETSSGEREVAEALITRARQRASVLR